MADNSPTPENNSTPALPIKKNPGGKVVVRLSSVAKAPPGGSTPVPDLSSKPVDGSIQNRVIHPPPLPGQTSPLPVRALPLPVVHREVELPPKMETPVARPKPPPLPPKASVTARLDSGKLSAKLIPPIKLQPPSTGQQSPAESIFTVDNTTPPPSEGVPKGWKQLEPGELESPGDLESFNVFGQTETPVKPVDPVPPVEDKKPELIVPPSITPPAVISGPAPVPMTALQSVAPVHPPPLPAKPVAESSSIFHAPPLLEKTPEAVVEKLPAPYDPGETRPATETVAKDVSETGQPKAPALISTEPKPVVNRPPALPSQTSASKPLKATGPIVLRDTPGGTSSEKSSGIVEVKADSAPVSPAIVQKAGLRRTGPIPVPFPLLKPEEIKTEKAAPPYLPSNIKTGPIMVPLKPEDMKVETKAKPAPVPQPEIKKEEPKVEARVEPTAKIVPSTNPDGEIIPGFAPLALPLVKSEFAKPSLRPPVLPNKTLAQPKPVTEPAAKLENQSVVGQKPKAEVSLPATPAPVLPVKSSAKPPLPLTRAERAKKRRTMELVGFYVVFVLTMIGLIFAGIYFGHETQLEGQIIPPAGMTLNDEVWIVGDFRVLSSGIAEDLANARAPLKQETQEKLEHVQRVQADVAAREERIRLLQDQIKGLRDEVAGVVKQSRDATQQLWDGPGAEMDDEYNSRLNELEKTIADRAKSLGLPYTTDENYRSPEVWANAFRLALYGTPPSVDSAKELQWLGDRMKQWRDFLKSLDSRKEDLREKAAQLKLAPAPKIADLNSKIDDLQHHIDSTLAEEEPLKAELQQAQSDLTQVQTTEAGLDDKYYKQLYTLPEGSITDHISLASNGRFTWSEIEKSKPFAEGEKEHNYWIFSRATRTDGRQYWALYRFTIHKNELLPMVIEPSAFISTKSILRPDLSPEEQAQ